MDYLLLAFVGFVAALTPGPDIFYVLKQGLCNGRKNAFMAVSGILSGNIIYLLLVGIGLNRIGQSPYFQMIIGFLGGIYLVRISILTFREKVQIDKTCEISKNIYKEALFLNLSNPKAMIFFAIIIAPFVSKNIMLSLMSLFLGISFAFIITAMISSKINLEVKILNFINKIASFVFLFFAIKLFNISFENFEIIIK